MKIYFSVFGYLSLCFGNYTEMFRHWWCQFLAVIYTNFNLLGDTSPATANTFLTASFHLSNRRKIFYWYFLLRLCQNSFFSAVDKFFVITKVLQTKTKITSDKISKVAAAQHVTRKKWWANKVLSLGCKQKSFNQAFLFIS